MYSSERIYKGVPYEHNQESLFDTGVTTTSAQTRAKELLNASELRSGTSGVNRLDYRHGGIKHSLEWEMGLQKFLLFFAQ